MLTLLINKVLRKAGTGSFLRNAGVLTGGTLLAQFIALASYPILTRLFTPSEFGVVSFVYMLTTILAIIGSGAAEGAILISNTRDIAANVIGWIIVRASFILLAALGLGIAANYTVLFDAFVDAEVKFWFPLAPVMAATIILINCCSEWYVREQEFSKLAKIKITQSMLIYGLRIIFGGLGMVLNGLVLGEFFGRMLTAFFGVRSIFKNSFKIFFNVRMNGIRQAKQRFIKFPRIMMPDQLLSHVAGTIHVPFISFGFGSETLGFVALTISLCYLPITVISSSIKDVFRQRAARSLKESGDARNLYLKLLVPISSIAFAGFGLLFLISPWVFSFALGENWSIVGDYTRILIPMFFVAFVSLSMDGVFVLTQKLKESLAWQIFGLSITSFCLFIGVVLYKNIEATLWLLVFAKVVSYLAHIGLSIYYARQTSPS